MLRRPPRSPLFFFNDTATTEIYTLSLHDALPISSRTFTSSVRLIKCPSDSYNMNRSNSDNFMTTDRKSTRLNFSHQIISYAVFCLKKKKKQITTQSPQTT